MQRIQGWSEQGNTKVSVQGLLSTTLVQKSFPGSTITVYLTGTVTLASLFSDDAASPTPLANPFTAGAAGTFGFYVANGRYDIVFSGTGISAPFTLRDFAALDGSVLVIDSTNTQYAGGVLGATPTAALQAAINAIPSGAGGTVQLPRGTITLTAALFNTNRKVNLIGAGRAGTILYWPTASADAGIAPTDGCRIAHMTIRGPQTGVFFSGNSGIDTGGVADVVIEDVIVEGWCDHGINTGQSSTRWKMYNFISRNNYDDGVLIAQGSSYMQLIAPFEVYNNGSNGIDLGGANNCTVGEGNVYGNGTRFGALGTVDTWGVLIQAIAGAGNDASNNSLIGTRVYGNYSDNITVRGVAGNVTTGTRIIGVQATASTAGSGISIDGSSGGTIQNTAITSPQCNNNASQGLYLKGDAGVGLVKVTTITGLIADTNGQYGFVVTGANVSDTNFSCVSLRANTSAPTFFAGSIRTKGFGVDVSTTAYGAYFGPRLDGVNGWEFYDLTAGARRLLFDSSGNVTVPSGNLTVSGAITAQTSLIVGTAGALAAVTKLLSASASLNFPNTLANSQSELTVAVTGAADQDMVALGVQSAGIPAGSFFGYVSAADTVTVRFVNNTVGAIDPGALTFKILVIHV